MTRRLYYTDAYLRQFEAVPLELADDGRRVYLDATAFYPTSGGQSHDLGDIDGVQVSDVVDEGDRIAHVLEGKLRESKQVRGSIDWSRRFDHMQQHTGQHLLSAVLADLFGTPTVSVHFGEDYATLDVTGQPLSAKQVESAEQRANQIVCENRPVTVSFEHADAAEGLRKASDRTGELRIVTIANLDKSACGGTHVAATGEIGAVLLRGTERVRDALRLQFVCGSRAIRRARADYQSASRLAAALSCSIDEVPELVMKQQARLREIEQRARRLERDLAVFQAQALIASTAPSADGIRRIPIPGEEGLEAARIIAQALTQTPKVLAVAAIEGQSTLLVATSEDSGLDAGKLLREAIASHSGRGGGSPRSAQGSLPSREALEAVKQTLLRKSD